MKAENVGHNNQVLHIKNCNMHQEVQALREENAQTHRELIENKKLLITLIKTLLVGGKALEKLNQKALAATLASVDAASVSESAEVENALKILNNIISNTA